MINRFDRVENVITEVAAKQTLSNAIAPINSAYVKISNLRNAKKREEREVALKEILKIQN